MTQAAKSHEPSMEEILASIRRIIADDDVKPEAAAAPVAAAPATAPPKAPPAAAAAPKPAPAPPPKPAPAAKAPEPKTPPAANPNNQDDIDALLAGLDADTSEAEVRGAAEPAAPEPDDDVLELTEQMEVAEDEDQSFKSVQPNDDIEFSEADMKPAEPRAQERAHVPVPPPVRPYEDSEPVPPQQPLMSQHTATAVNSAFNALAQTVLSNNARTLEDLVKEMLRPMLRSWLDDNLPGLVEKIVRAEIERVSRGR
jgi:cell pole-organizing protein PopZ